MRPLSLQSRSACLSAHSSRHCQRLGAKCRNLAGSAHLSLARARSQRTARTGDQSCVRSSTSNTPFFEVNPPVGGGNGGGSGSEGSSKQLGGDDDSEPSSSEELQAVLATAGKGLNDLPADLAEALKEGRLSKQILQRFLGLQNSILGPLLAFGGMRERLLADPNFIVKVAIEVGIGLFTKSSAEYSKRRENFMKEIDFVGANVIMALVADFCLVFLPAPTLSLAAKRSGGTQNAAVRWLASCPDNAFQKVPKGRDPFSLSQRVGAIVRNGLKLFVVGFGSSVIGVGATNALTEVRKRLDPDAGSPNPPQNVLDMSSAYGVYMAVSSNLRYQIIAGVLEERLVETVLHSNPRLQNVLSFVIRTSNTFLGSLLWIDYIRFIGLQPAKSSSK